MTRLYPLVEAAVMAACLGPLLFAAARIAGRRGVWPAMGWAAAGLAWWLLVWELSRSGAFEGTRASAPLAAMVVTAIPLATGLSGLALRRGALSLLAPVADVMALQTLRVVAVVVLLAWAGEALPAWLALPIALGEIVVGLAAPAVARRLRAGAAGTAAWGWTLVGMAVAAFTIAAPIASARSSGYFFSLYPLVLFPTFLAPCSLLLHAVTLRELRRPEGFA